MEGSRLETRTWGWMAEFDQPEDLLSAAERVREEGYRNVDAYAPMPVHGLPEALGLGRTWIPQIVLAAGLLGAIGGFVFLYYITVIHYPHNVGGRPFFSWPSYIPIMFETTVLLAAICGVIAMIALNGLPKPYHPVFNVPEFLRASQDKFFLVIEASDPQFDKDRTREFLEGLQPAGLHYVED